MTDLDQPTPRPAPWSPLPVDAATRATSPSAIADGPVIRSPALHEVSEGSDVPAVAWPWDRPADQPPTVPARPVSTEDLYRDEAGEAPRKVSVVAEAQGERHPSDVAVDPFYLPGQSTDASVDNAGMKTWGVVLTDVVATTLAATVDMYVNLRPTWITGAVFILACVITAIQVRRTDLSVAVIAPPLAFVFAIAVAAATSSMGETGSMMLRIGRDIFTALAFNAPFVFGGTGLALVIVAIRAMRTSRA